MSIRKESRRINRPTTVHGAAWSLPVIAAAVATPLAADTRTMAVCGTPASLSGWDAILVQGSLAGASYSTPTAVPDDTLSSIAYTTHFENRTHAGDANAVAAIVTVTGTADVIAGRMYRISQYINVRFPGDDTVTDGANTAVDIRFGGEVLFQGTARPASSRQTISNGPSPQEVTYTWFYTAAMTGTVAYEYRFTLGADQKKRNPDRSLGNPSIAVRWPIISYATGITAVPASSAGTNF